MKDGKPETQIPKPLMPLGVEYHRVTAKTTYQEIPKPLMPLGVEHELRERLKRLMQKFRNLCCH
ncbi:hypothetical protein [Microcoleus sp. D3_18_C4]|uniref:hypothetical protein n=1 Tax=Microcoleus sp. D3_18_C4 TaxID=3055335 RepID=UPI002FD6A5D1